MSRVWLLMAAVLVCGCGKEPVRAPEQPKPEPPKPATLAELLGKPRKELAVLTEECADKGRMEARDFEADAGANPWDAIRFPLTAPVWQEATYSEQAGFSLPRYSGAGDQGQCPRLAPGTSRRSRRRPPPGRRF